MKAKLINLTQEIVSRFNDNRLPPIYTECHYWHGSFDAKGYGRMKVVESGKKITYLAHRISYQIHKGNVPSDKCVCHKCDNPACVNPDHLWLGSVAENDKDRNLKGRHSKGISHVLACGRLTESQVRLIISDKRRLAHIAKDYGVSPSTIYHIRLGNTWKHLTT